MFIKGGVMIGLGFHILFSYLIKEAAWPSGHGYSAVTCNRDSRVQAPAALANCQLGLFHKTCDAHY